MFGHQRQYQLIWYSIFIEVLIFNLETQGQNHPVHNYKTLVGQNLVNASLVNTVEKEQETKYGHGRGEDMLAMVASLKGNSYASETEYKIEESNGNILKFDWHMKLDQSNRYGLDWTVDYARNKIIFALNINHTNSRFRRGFDIFALGFSKNSKLAQSDFCIIWYDLSYKLHLQDARTDAGNRLQLIDSARSQCKLLKFPRLERSKVGESVDDSEWVATTNKNDEQYGRSTSSEYDSVEPVEIIFKRPLDVCDSGNDSTYYRIDNGTTHLVWFTIKGPLLSIDGLNLTELASSTDERVAPTSANTHYGNHGKHEQSKAVDSRFECGMVRVQLIASKAAKEPKTASAMIMDIRMEQFEIPAKETTYWCKLFKLPHKFESRRYHLTKYEAAIEQGNEHVVHHMELFNCANLDTDQEQGLHNLYENGGWSGDCGGSDRPKATKPCRRVVIAWAMGAHPLIYPEQVGQSIGGHGYSPYVVLEVHYNNVASSSGIIDNSGLRFHYTSRLRPFDAGVLEVGLEYTDKISIPPNMVTPIAGHCVGECTRVSMSSGGSSSSPLALPSGKSRRIKHGSLVTSDSATLTAISEDLEDGIYIFAAQMHTHLTGVASWTEIVREGKLVKELQRDNHYSPHFQEIRLLPNPVHVAPGDALIHYCLYDTRQRINITLGGDATTDEMCVTYLHYYPRIDLEVCKSSVDARALENYFAYLADEEGQGTSEILIESRGGGYPGAKSVSENYHSISWTPRRSKELIQFYANAPLSVQCNRSNGDRWPGHWNGMSPTRLRLDLAELGQPFETKLPKGDQLIAYRGRGFGDRHAQCKINGQRLEKSTEA